MSHTRTASQPDLFQPADRPGYRAIEEIEPPPEDFIQRIRDELAATLATARGAQSLPWRDLTQTMLVEMRFHSIAETWLPDDESAPLRAAFAIEMERLYAIAETAASADSQGIPTESR